MTRQADEDHIFPTEDESWETALGAVQSCLAVPNILNGLVRNSWAGLWETREFMRALGFVGLNARCLMRAAEMPPDGADKHAADVERAVALLGVRTSAVVVAINYVCQTVLKSNPPDRLWVGIFREMMTLVEIGYRFGCRAEGIGPEGGMLMGFVRTAGLAILLAEYPKEFSEWFAKSRGVDTPHFVKETFGCETYQVGAVALQQLGFGTDIAIAAALAVGNLQHDMIEVPRHVINWKAAYLWIECLRNGQSYPKDILSRNCFDGLTPPKLGSPASPALGLLYSQVANIRRKQSDWNWHLPNNTYDETTKSVAGRRAKHLQYSTSRRTMVFGSE